MAELNAGLLELEREPATAQRIEPLMRSGHSLKGAARIIGLDPAVQLAHEMEDVFVAAGAARIRMTPTEIDVLLRSADLLATLAKDDLSLWGIVRAAEIASLHQAVAAIARGEAGRAVVATNLSVTPPLPVVQTIPNETTFVPTVPDTRNGSVIAEPSEAVVRVTAQSLDRLMNLAGESLVQSRWLQPFAGSLMQLKKRHDRLATLLDVIAQNAGVGSLAVELEHSLSETKRESPVSRQ